MRRVFLLFILILFIMPLNVYATEIEDSEKQTSREIENNEKRANNPNKWEDIQYDGIEIHNNCKVINKKIVSQYKNGGSYYITNYVYEKSLEYLNNVDYDFSNKTIAFLGDSITYGANSGDDEYEITYEMVVKEKLKAKEVYNFGIGGSTIGDYWADPMCLRYVEIPKDVDYIVVFGGINDVFCVNEELFGNLTERKEKTFCGDLNRLMLGLKQDYPNTKIIFATPLVTRMCYDLQKDEEFSYMLDEYDYANVIKSLAQEYDIDVIDFYSSGILNTYDDEVVKYYIPDTVHPNNDGYNILGTIFAKEIVEINHK